MYDHYDQYPVPQQGWGTPRTAVRESLLDEYGLRKLWPLLAGMLTGLLLVLGAFALLRSGSGTDIEVATEARLTLPPTSVDVDRALAEADDPASEPVTQTPGAGPEITSVTVAAEVDEASTTTTVTATSSTTAALPSSTGTSATVVASTSSSITATTAQASSSSSSALAQEQPTTSSTASTASTTSSTATTSTTVVLGDDTAIQQAVLDATNAERAQVGCPPLRLDPVLNRVADGHSEDMAARGYFSHDDPEGNGPGHRVAVSGYPYRSWGENIAAGQRTAAEVVEDWMNSDGHRENILNCGFDELGVGYGEGLSTGRVPGRYWTQVFATRAG